MGEFKITPEHREILRLAVKFGGQVSMITSPGITPGRMETLVRKKWFTRDGYIAWRLTEFGATVARQLGIKAANYEG